MDFSNATFFYTDHYQSRVLQVHACAPAQSLRMTIPDQKCKKLRKQTVFGVSNNSLSVFICTLNKYSIIMTIISLKKILMFT